jgi:hypothetical protein
MVALELQALVHAKLPWLPDLLFFINLSEQRDPCSDPPQLPEDPHKLPMMTW